MENQSNEVPVYAVFTERKLGYKGNPAAIVEVSEPLSENDMQVLAAKYQQPATTFLVRNAQQATEFWVRWFAPDEEIGLCGHGAAAAGAYLGQKYKDIETFTLRFGSGEMEVHFHYPDQVSLLLDAIPVIQEIEVPQAIRDGLGIPVLAMYETGNKHLILTESEQQVQGMQPNFDRLRDSEIFGYAVTAPGSKVDFVSRTFVPHVQQLEDFATGSSHAMLSPFWSQRLEKKDMIAHQLSSRGGVFNIQLLGSKVRLSGYFTRENDL
ncbi:MAG: PhzF family phenazine biosynthesis protein [Lunatimonas sp.]|uniref:PhzF family phenazine biosynthesis protein n=1 Tax=Lunatimonas sp. TaxID=2060141 RepID=UPI00263B5F9D|nr:PhzF family phenazine biosynthesis isomerase [Lunatimonas sp.]MCC5938168.1 PhzF family phenazine biosynthesis protein [Lunatimonas sp.]